MTGRHLRIPAALAVASTLFLSAPAMSQNLLDNGEFNDDVEDAGWSVLSGQPLEWQTADRNSCPLSGDLHLFVSPIFGPDPGRGGTFTAFAWSDCLTLPGGLTALHLDFEWTDNNLATAGVVKYPDSFCADLPTPQVSTLPGDESAWNHFHGAVVVSGVGSLRVEIGFSGAAFNSLIFDRVYLGVLPLSFVDDFEGGAVCRWTGT